VLPFTFSLPDVLPPSNGMFKIVSDVTFNSTGGYDGFGAYEFDGVDDVIRIEDDATLRPEVFTITAWINPRSINTVTFGDRIVSKTQSGGFGYELNHMNISGNIQLVGLIGNSTDFAIINKSADIQTNTWQYVAMTYNGSIVELFLNGESIGADTAGNITHSAQPLHISSFSGESFFYNGHIDEIRLYNRTLSAQQIDALFENKTDLIVSNELTSDDTWFVNVTPNDRTQDGTTTQSNNVTIIANQAPTIAQVILNTSTGLNITTENLTAFFINVSDLEGEEVKNITNYFVNGTSITVLNMPFEGGSTTGRLALNGTTQDYSPFENNGAVINSTFDANGGHDSFGAYVFDGINDFIEIEDDDSLDFGTGSFSVETWVKTTAKVTQCILCKSTGATEGYQLFIEPITGTAQPFVGDGTSSVFFNGTTNISDNTYHHVAMTWNTSLLRLFVDGIEEANKTGTIGSISNTLPLLIAAQCGQSACTSVKEFLNGSISEVRIYNRTLSADQILAIAENRTDIIVSNETAVGDTWFVNVTPNDRTQDGTSVVSNNVTILNAAPTIAQVVLNATTEFNTTADNLTAFFLNVTDLDGDDVKNITNFFVNGTSITVLNMPFEGGSTNGSTGFTKDYTPFENDGTVNATFTSTGGFDGFGAYSFIGGNKITIGDPADGNLEATGDKTIMAWINATGSGSGSILRMILAKKQDAAIGYYITIRQATGTINAFWQGVNGTVDFDSNVTVNDSTWHHVATTKSSSGVKLYVDGVEERSNTTDVGSISNSLNFRIGDSDHSLDHFFEGLIDEVLVFNRSLSSEQIRAIYENRTDRIVSNETGAGDTWFVNVTPNDRVQDGESVLSNNVTILNAAPTIAQVVLNTSTNLNLTGENLTAFFLNVSDADGDDVKNITNFFVNEGSITVLNMPFEGGSTSGSESVNGTTKDYSSFVNTGEVVNATFNSTGGYDGFGAYEFDGIDDFIAISDDTSFDNIKTVSLWIKPKTTFDSSGPTRTEEILFKRQTSSPFQGFVLTIQESSGNGGRIFMSNDNGTTGTITTSSTFQTFNEPNRRSKQPLNLCHRPQNRKRTRHKRRNRIQRNHRRHQTLQPHPLSRPNPGYSRKQNRNHCQQRNNNWGYLVCQCHTK